MKQDVLTERVKDLFNTINEEDILQELKGGDWRFEDKKIEKPTQELLIAEARRLLSSALWKVLKKDVQWQANKRMFLKGQGEMDMIMGKAWLYVLDCIKTRLESLNKERGIFNTKPIKPQ